MYPTVGVDHYFRRRSYESNQRVENSSLYGCLGWRAYDIQSVHYLQQTYGLKIETEASCCEWCQTQKCVLVTFKKKKPTSEVVVLLYKTTDQ